MLTLLVVVVVGVISALVFWARAPRRASSAGDPDHDVDEDVVAAAPAGALATRAVVAGLRQEGMSRGVVVHRCSLELLVEPAGEAGRAEAPSPATCTTDVDLSVLRWVAPGSLVDVLVHPADSEAPVRASLLPGATRDRVTGRSSLPAVDCRRLDAAFTDADDRRIDEPLVDQAIVGCVDVTSSEHRTTHSTTLGLWLVGAGRAVTVSDRYGVLGIAAVARGGEVAVRVDPTDERRVVVDAPGAVRAWAAALPGPADLDRARQALGLGGQVGRVTAAGPSGRQLGVREGVRVEVVPVDPATGEATGAAVTADLLLPIPDQLLLVPRSAVVLRDPAAADGDHPKSGPVDLDATARARGWCGVEAAGWGSATDDL